MVQRAITRPNSGTHIDNNPRFDVPAGDFHIAIGSSTIRRSAAVQKYSWFGRLRCRNALAIISSSLALFLVSFSVHIPLR